MYYGFINHLILRLVLLLTAVMAGSINLPRAQQPSTTPPPADEVLRINTDLVQTAITVVDKQGRFVEGLDREHWTRSEFLGADLPLKSLTPGRYDLRVKIIDAVAGTSVTQSTDFVVQ
jgi:hypothetical protein